MKALAAILFSAVIATLVLVAPHDAIAQEPIDHGFFFFDGEYIEAPYTVEAESLAVYINGYQITAQLQWPPLQDCMFDHDPGLPESVTVNSTLEEALSYCEPSGIPYHTAYQWYVFTHADYESAFAQMLEYYESLACVSSLEHDGSGSWVLEAHSGETMLIGFDDRILTYLNEWYGPDGTGAPPLDEYEEQVGSYRTCYEEMMGDDVLLLAFEDGQQVIRSCVAAANVLPEALDVLESVLSDSAKCAELVSLGLLPRCDEECCLTFVQSFGASEQLDQRVAELREWVEEEYGPEALHPVVRDEDLIAQAEKDAELRGEVVVDRERDFAYSPDGCSIYAYCPYTYEGAFGCFYAEIADVIRGVIGQDYNRRPEVYVDSRWDFRSGAATRSNLLKMRYGDIVYLASHGHERLPGDPVGYVEVARFPDRTTADLWTEGDPDLVVQRLTTAAKSHPGTSGGHRRINIYVVKCSTTWAENHWKPTLDRTNAISILSCCWSHQNGWTAAVGGAAAFGYGIPTTGGACMRNNFRLLWRMNGLLPFFGTQRYRQAWAAYANAADEWEKLFNLYPPGAAATLAPSPCYIWPEDGSDSVPASGTGLFQLDTYCHAPTPATCTGELTFQRVGDVAITNVRWDSPGKSNKILFDWAGGTDFAVTVTAHKNRITSWGAKSSSRHRMDGNRINPIREDCVYTFSRGNPSPVEGSCYAVLSESGAALVRWSVASLDGISGFNVYRATSSEGPFTRLNEDVLPVASSVYEDTAVWPETTFWYEIRAVMGDGHEEVVTGSPTKVTTGGRLNAALYAPSPNPTAGSTSIRFDVPTHVGPVKLMVYNVKGQLVRAIVNGESERGRHVSIWDGTNTQGQRVPSGVYFVRFSVGGETKTNKMMVLR